MYFIFLIFKNSSSSEFPPNTNVSNNWGLQRNILLWLGNCYRENWFDSYLGSDQNNLHGSVIQKELSITWDKGATILEALVQIAC